MSNNFLVSHINGHFRLKFRSVVRGVENCSLGWVEFGKTWRNLTEEEAVTARNQQAQTRDPLPFAELPSLIYRPAERNQAQTRQGFEITRAANQFAALGT